MFGWLGAEWILVTGLFFQNSIFPLEQGALRSHYQHVNWNSQNLGQRWLELTRNSVEKALGIYSAVMDLDGLMRWCVFLSLLLRCFLASHPSPHLPLSSAPFRFDQIAAKCKSPYFFHSLFIWLCNSLHTLLNQKEHFNKAPAIELREHVEASLEDCPLSNHTPLLLVFIIPLLFFITLPPPDNSLMICLVAILRSIRITAHGCKCLPCYCCRVGQSVDIPPFILLVIGGWESFRVCSNE